MIIRYLMVNADTRDPCDFVQQNKNTWQCCYCYKYLVFTDDEDDDEDEDEDDD